MALPPLLLEGRRFGRLTVISRALSKKKQSFWLVRCDCGDEKDIRQSSLVNGDSVSCGCFGRAESARRLRERARTHGLSKTTTYTVWAQMIQRCNNAKATSYDRYGGRGIRVCQRWLDDFRSFLADMGERPASTTLDRIDNDRGYEPGNCRWATVEQQNRNRRNSHLYEFEGQTLCRAEVARILDARTGIGDSVIEKRLASGWLIERASTTPKRRRGRSRLANPKTRRA